MKTVQAIVNVHQLEPGTHITRSVVRFDVSTETYTIPTSEVSEVRPDWGLYNPIPTLPALERALTARGAFPVLPADHVYYFGFR